MPLLPGEILNKRYRIVSLLATGSYGATYRARDEKVGQDVVVKEYLDASVNIQKRFRAEARRLSGLRHYQIPTFLDHFALENSGQYLVSAYVDGVDLGSLSAQYGPLPSDLIVPWLQGVCQPLIYLHEKNRLHLDIKPANIRLALDGELFLVDSGLPGLGIRPHENGYGSPEQQAQLDVDAASDVYSLGATLYTLLTAVIPPNALSRESGLVDLKPAREVNPDVEPYLSLVASRAMSLRSDARYESVTAFAGALQRPSGHPIPPTDQLRRTADPYDGTLLPKLPPRQRKQMERRTMLALGGLLLIILIGIAGFAFVNLQAQDEVGDSEVTATFVSAVIAAATQLAPTPTLTPPPTVPPTPTPEPFVSQTGSRMIYVPPGQFRMGFDEGEKIEAPSHMIDLNSFYIDETEVTNGEYAQCVDAGACDPPNSPNATYHPAYYGSSNYDNYPVIFVNWYDAYTFCEWRDARLPTEAEWEKAAGFDPEQMLKLRYPWGNAFDGVRLNSCDVNCSQAEGSVSFDDGHADTAPVGTYPDGRSSVGIYDLSGNVMEWVADWYGREYYVESTDTNPLGPLEGEYKIVRGGSWLSSADKTNVTSRISYDPLAYFATLGFRCAMDLP